MSTPFDVKAYIAKRKNDPVKYRISKIGKGSGGGALRFTSFIPKYQHDCDFGSKGEDTQSHAMITLPEGVDNKEWVDRAQTCCMKGDKVNKKFSLPQELKGFWIYVYTLKQCEALWDEFKALPNTDHRKVRPPPDFSNLKINPRAEAKAQVEVVKAPDHGEHIWALIGPGKYLIQNQLEREVNNDQIFVKAEDAVPGIEGYIFDARVLEPPVVKRVCDNWGFACNIYDSIAPAA